MKTGVKYDLSEESLLECTNSSDCGGGYVDYALPVVINGKGMPTETRYPYKAINMRAGKPTTAGICKATNKVYYSGPTVAYKYTNLNLDQVKNLLTISPIIALFYAPSRLSSFGTGVFSCTADEMTQVRNHFILLVGYNTDGNLLVKNSWGASWGDAGFFWISGADSNDCKIKSCIFRIGSSMTSSYGGNLIIAAMLLVGVVLSLA